MCGTFTNDARVIAVVFAVSAVLVLSAVGSGRCQDADCMDLQARWEQAVQAVQDKLQGLAAVQQTPVDRIVQRPLVDPRDQRPIAQQISEALQAKEALLNMRRKECRDVLTLENQIHGQYEECAQRGDSKKAKRFKELTKKRRALLDKAVVALAEVKEVQGEETQGYYSDAMNRQQGGPYSRSANNYWQNYQQMYQRWWGR